MKKRDEEATTLVRILREWRSGVADEELVVSQIEELIEAIIEDRESNDSES